jgi:hypothetical protein
MYHQSCPLIKQPHYAKQNEKQKSPLMLDKKVLFPIASHFEILHYIIKRAMCRLKARFFFLRSGGKQWEYRGIYYDHFSIYLSNYLVYQQLLH